MQKFSSSQVLLGLLLLGSFASAQNASQPASRPVAASPGFFASQNIHAKHMAFSHVSAATNAAVKTQNPSVVTLPSFTRSFTFGGTVFPYTMVGHDPSTNRPTSIPTTYVPMSFVFQGIRDLNGNVITIDATAITDEIKGSPLFQPADLPNGNLQFEDAQMRAEFFPLLKPNNSNWHVTLGTPQTLIPVTIEVPFGDAELFEDPTTLTIVAIVDFNFLRSQLDTLLQTEGISPTTVPIFITRNTVYANVNDGVTNFNTCCIGGFHTAFETATSKNIFVQTYAFATSLDAAAAEFAFGDPGVFADINALSHEVGETLNDPFVNNITPNYQLPGFPPGACQNILEVGDVVEGLTPDYVPLTLNGFTYHPQTLGLLQWFEGVTTSDAFNGQFSFPGQFLTGPFTPCPATP